MSTLKNKYTMHPATIETAQQTILEHLPVAILIVDRKGWIHYYNQEADKICGTFLLESGNIKKWAKNPDQHNFEHAINSLDHNSQAAKFHISIDHNSKEHFFELKMIINPEENFSKNNLGKNNDYLITLNVIDMDSITQKESLTSKESLTNKESSTGNKPSTSKESFEYKKNFKELKQFARLSAMREISSSLADKLNQPLTAILSYTQAMQRLYQQNASSEEIDEAMERVVVNAQNAGKVIKNIRAQLNVNTLEIQEVSMNQIVQESIHLTELDSSDSPIHFITHFESSSMMLCVDKIQMRQVVFSLLNNAIDAVMEPSISDPEIILTTRLNSINDKSYYEIIISDNGPGFPKEIQHKLFEPFTTTKKNGIGIGLSMCHHIIDLHKGSITIEQPETKVTVCLPTDLDDCPDKYTNSV
ncbi:MAG: ATP-binding protein [Gammaproteobacteria bacterium]|nr:ATP-binding protein [Gammaproteobacteria bacterium]